MIKILIVDDSNFSQKITANLLKKYIPDLELYFANNGQEGYEKYKEIKPHYLFVDLLMPNLNGKEMISLVKEYHSEAKIVVVSADVQKSVREEVEQLGVLYFLNKPFNDEKAIFICGVIRIDRNE